MLHPLTRDPFFRALDGLFTDPSSLRRPTLQTRTASAGPQVNGYQTDAAYVVVFEVPGLTEDQLDLQVEDGALTVSADVQKADEEQGQVLLRERTPLVHFRRKLGFADDADLEQTTATLAHGLLTVTVPRRVATVRRIQIQAS